MNKEDIIKQSKKNHTILYDYSLLKDKYNMNDNIPINCFKHGLFTPRLSRFLKGSNCPLCSGKGLKTKEMFVEEANNIHKNQYTYENFIYINSHTKSFITCPKHGDFLQNPTNHLNGCGCPECKKEKLSKLFISDTETFIKKANIIHNNYYSYTKTVYEGNDKPCIITCPKHGDFEQLPHNHLQGKGCPKCNSSKLEKDLRIFFIIHNIKFEEQKHFDWLDRLSLDFYLPDYNIAIECQGKQHFNLGGWDKNFDFDNQYKRDILKNKKCFDNKITLFYYTLEEYNNITKYNIYNKDNIINNLNILYNILSIIPLKQQIINFLNKENITYVEDKNTLIINKYFKINIIDDVISYPNFNILNKISIKDDENNIRNLWIKFYEWNDENKQNILKSFILSACGKIKKKYYGRNCYIKELTNKDIKDFLIKNSMYGYRQSSVILGLFNKFNNELLMVYTFGYPYYGHNKYDIEVIRAATKINTQVIGGASKLWNFFIHHFSTIKIGKKYIKWKKCVYYVDFDHNNGNSLKYLNFDFNYYTSQGFHNLLIKDKKIINRNPNKYKELKELILNNDALLIPTSGTKVYTYIKKEE